MDLARFDREVEAVEGGERAEALDEAVDLDDRRCGCLVGGCGGVAHVVSCGGGMKIPLE